MSYIDDFIAANAGSMTREELVTRLRGAGYSDGEIKAAMRRGGSRAPPTSSPGSTPAQATVSGLGPEAASVSRRVQLGSGIRLNPAMVIGAVVAIIVLVGLATGALQFDVYLIVIPLVAYRLWTFLRGDARKPSPSPSSSTMPMAPSTAAATETAWPERPAWTRRGIVRMMVILVAAGVVVLTLLTLLVLGATTPASPTTGSQSSQAALELAAMIGIAIGAAVLLGVGYLATRWRRAAE